MKIEINTDKLELIIDGKSYNLASNEQKEVKTINYKANIETEPQRASQGFNLSNTSHERLKGVHPKLINVVEQAIVKSKYDFIITQGLRTAEYQHSLYEQGRTKAGAIVTNCDGYIKKSNHQAKADGYGYAIDFAIYDKTKEGNIDWNSIDKYREVANLIIDIGKANKLNIEWGGNWKSFKDYPHIELKGVM